MSKYNITLAYSSGSMISTVLERRAHASGSSSRRFYVLVGGLDAAERSCLLPEDRPVAAGERVSRLPPSEKVQ